MTKCKGMIVNDKVQEDDGMIVNDKVQEDNGMIVKDNLQKDSRIIMGKLQEDGRMTVKDKSAGGGKRKSSGVFQGTIQKLPGVTDEYETFQGKTLWFTL
jgi:hypothetical protein